VNLVRNSATGRVKHNPWFMKDHSQQTARSMDCDLLSELGMDMVYDAYHKTVSNLYLLQC
jgi:hypothetical protein